MEIMRLKQGLAFYQTTQQAGMKFLELCLSQHPLGKEALEFSKQFGLDTLKSFYVAKHTYATSGRFQVEDYGFSTPIG